MGYNRPQSKWLARDAMRGAYPHPMLVSLVYLLLTSVLGNVVMSFVSNPFDAAYYYLTQTNYPVDEIMSAIFTPSRMAVLLLMELLLNLYFWVMRYGYTSYCLRLTRREGPSYRNLLDGFYSMGRALGVNFLVALFQFLWGLIGVAVYVVFVLVGVFLGSGLAVLMGIVSLVVWNIYISYRYRLAVYFLLDHPEMGVLEAIRSSRETMRGVTGTLFVQDMSFLGWSILSIFTLGILNLWLAPYVGCAEANFYHWEVYGSYPERPSVL